jgi:DtxR family Mn-dependent transcriptional regulator
MTAPDPLLSLALFAAATAVILVVVWPRRGLLWRWRDSVRNRGRVEVEDALKHLYHCESKGIAPTLQSVAGSLHVSTDRSAAILGRMEALGLLERSEGRLALTGQGRSQALHVIRVHRLWERYLADRTSLDDVDWHRRAERWEHRTSPEEADELEARLGYPRYDPHGDPIPTAEGEMAPPQATALPDLEPGRAARIVHVEDEPEAVYAQIAALNLYPGLTVRMIDATRERIRFWARGEEHVLAPIVAANVGVHPRPEEGVEGGDRPGFETLADLSLEESARVVQLTPSCRGMERQRLLDLGVVPGTIIRAVSESPMRDPVGYQIRGATVALRREQAAMIQVERVSDQEAVS